MTLPPSYPDWWRCCYCLRETDPSFHGEQCPDCGHYQCATCGYTLEEKVVCPAPTSPPTRVNAIAPITTADSLSEDNVDVVESQNMLAEEEDDEPALLSLAPDKSHAYVGGLQRKLSRTSSLDSLAASLFSNLSGSSKSSTQGPEGAAERLAFILFSDPVLQSLFQTTEVIALDRFERNLRRLLTIFSKDLYEEARSTKGRLVARFVRSQARTSASLICNELDPEGDRSRLDNKERDDSDSDFEDDEMVDLQLFERIILKSSALEKLRANLRQFIGPAENISTEDIALTALDISFLDNGLNMIPDVGSIMMDINKMKNKIWRPPPLAKGMKRVTWTCTCGKKLYDDYEELETGAAKKFQRDLRRQTHRQLFHQFHGYQYSAQGVFRSLVSVGMILTTLVKSAYERFSTKITELPTVELQHQLGSQPTVPARGQSQPAEQLFLLLCINDKTGGLVARGYQPAVNNIDSDRKLFHMLRSYYKSLRPGRWSWASLWKLQHIYFVHFDMYEKSLIDIKEHNAIPPDELGNLYQYERSNLKPPIGSNLLTHYFNCPEDAPSLAPCFRRIPKKIGQQLTVCPVKGVSPGWGLHFVEGFSWKKILTISCFTFVLTSVGVGVLYWKFKHSIQDSFAIGSFILACFGVSISTLQAWSCMV